MQSIILNRDIKSNSKKILKFLDNNISEIEFVRECDINKKFTVEEKDLFTEILEEVNITRPLRLDRFFSIIETPGSLDNKLNFITIINLSREEIKLLYIYKLMYGAI